MDALTGGADVGLVLQQLIAFGHVGEVAFNEIHRLYCILKRLPCKNEVVELEVDHRIFQEIVGNL